MYLIEDLPNLENEFNFLIPCISIVDEMPYYINLAFFDETH